MIILLLPVFLLLLTAGNANAQALEHDGHNHHPKDSTSTEISCPMGANCSGGTGVCEVRPNPCQDYARIHLMAPANSHVRVRIYNSNMSLVKELTNRVVPGDIEAVWDGTDESGQRVSSGIYFCRMECSAQANQTEHNHAIRSSELKKIVLTR